jgi:trk system potassium uptake protein TrkA
LNKQIVVIGLGRLGEALASTLCGIGHEVLALDQDEALVERVAPSVTHAVQVDPTSESALRELGVSNFDVGVVAVPSIETSVLSTLLLKKLGVRYVIARATNDLHEIILAKIGADKVVSPEREIGAGMAYVLTLGDVIDYIPVTAAYGVVKMSAPPHFVGKSLAELGFGQRSKLEVIVLILQRKQEVLIGPGGIEAIRAGDVLVVAGEWDKLESLLSTIQKAKEKEGVK